MWYSVLQLGNSQPHSLVRTQNKWEIKGSQRQPWYNMKCAAQTIWGLLCYISYMKMKYIAIVRSQLPTKCFQKSVYVELESWPLNEPLNCLWRKCSSRLPSHSFPCPLCFLRVQKPPPATRPFSLLGCDFFFNLFIYFVFPLLPWKGEGCWGCGKAGSVISHRVRLLMRPSSQHWQIKCIEKACLLDYEHSPGCQLIPFNYFPSWQKETISDLSGSLVRWWLSLCHLAGRLAPPNPGLLKTCCTVSLGSDFEKFPEMF